MLHREFPVNTILTELEKDSLLPAILFRTSRRQCDVDVERLSLSRVGSIPPKEQRKIDQEVQNVIDKYGMDSEMIRNHPQYEALVTTSVGAHHAGQLIVWRLLLEELMSRGVMRMMIATGTVAAGVDFPARTVVVTAHSKRGTNGFQILSSSEFQQMSGRAGRRGKDSVGFCLIAPSAYSDARVIHQVAARPPEPLRSAYYAAPSTVLNLLKYRTADDLRHTVSRSLGAFLDRKAAKVLLNEAAEVGKKTAENQKLTPEQRKKGEKRARRIVKEADRLEQRQQNLLETSLQGLTRLGHIVEGKLTEKGAWAAELCTSIVLELAEAIDEGLLGEVVLDELIGLVASIAGDPHRSYFGIRQNPIKKEYFARMQACVDRVAALYEGSPFASEVVVLPDAAVAVLTWVDSSSWQDFAAYLRLAGVAEGDVARLISQTADHLNQISRLSESHPDLAIMALEARRLLLRPPITDAFEVGVLN